MIRSREYLEQSLAELEAGMQAMLDKHPESGDFWAAFALQADHIDAAAAPADSTFVHDRIDALLRRFDLDPAGWEAPDDPDAVDQIEPVNNR